MSYSLRDLDYFTRLAAIGHFGRTATACHITQPALSASLLKLEDALGGQLLERYPKGIILTPLGQRALPLAQAVLAANSQLQDVARRAAAPLAGPLRLGIIPTLGPYLMPLLLPPLKAQASQLQLFVHELMTQPLLEALHSGALDMGILALPIADKSVAVYPCGAEALRLALPQRHPLARQKKVTLREVQALELMLLADGHCLQEHASQACKLTAGNKHPFAATSLETLKHMVAAGTGVTLLPALAAQPLTGMAIRPIVGTGGASPQRQLAVVTRRGSPFQAAAMALREVLKPLLREAI